MPCRHQSEYATRAAEDGVASDGISANRVSHGLPTRKARGSAILSKGHPARVQAYLSLTQQESSKQACGIRPNSKNVARKNGAWRTINPRRCAPWKMRAHS